jgi:hypothetical protein
MIAVADLTVRGDTVPHELYSIWFSFSSFLSHCSAFHLRFKIDQTKRSSTSHILQNTSWTAMEESLILEGLRIHALVAMLMPLGKAMMPLQVLRSMT